MGRVRQWYLAGLAGSFVIVASVIVFSSGHGYISAANGGTVVPSRAVLPTTLPPQLRATVGRLPATWPAAPTISPQDGSPGIVPHLTVTDPKAATFTEQDVRDYYAKNQAQMVGSQIIITKISFITVADANSTLGLKLAFDGREPVCVVQRNENGSYSDGVGVRPYTTVFEIYDARTGKLVAFTLR